MPSRQRANAGLDQNPVTSSIIFREGAPSRDPQVLIIALALTGPADSVLARVCDEVVSFDSSATSTIQECHLLIAHELCAAVDAVVMPVNLGVVCQRILASGRGVLVAEYR
ncbi:hypothetical protein IU487_36440 [Nocardia puris]|nr:hypothetical protein [Nocardia puris]